MASATRVAMEATYKCSKSSTERMKQLTRLAGFTSDNQISRLAITRSLLEPLPAEIPDPVDQEGKEIKGLNLLGRDGPARLLLALIVVHAGAPQEGDALRKLVAFHWERGLVLLDDEIERDGNAFDLVLARLAASSVLTDDDFEDEDGKPPSPEDLLGARIVGQEEARKSVSRLLQEAAKSSPPVMAETLLFTGPASTGKTLFSKTIAETLRLPYVEVTGSMIDSAERLFDQIDATLNDAGQAPTPVGTKSGLPLLKYPPLVIFIDEAHTLKRSVQDALLTMTEPSEREAKLATRIADMRDATVLLATTDSAKLAKPFKTRCTEIRLSPYSRDEIAEIIGRSYKGWGLEVRRLLAMAGRVTPRIAKERAKSLNLILTQDHNGSRPTEALVTQIMADDWGLDRLGLGRTDHQYLQLLAASNQPVGLSNLASQMGIEQAQLELEIEPFLVALNLVERTAKGRLLTLEGRQLVQDAEVP